jgi:hypothetical protein
MLEEEGEAQDRECGDPGPPLGKRITAQQWEQQARTDKTSISLITDVSNTTACKLEK